MIRPLAMMATLAFFTSSALAADPPPRVVEAVIRDLDGKPAVGAVVVAGFAFEGRPNHRVFRTDADGRFSWTISEGEMYPAYVVYKEGRAPLLATRIMPAGVRADHVDWQLAPPATFRAKLVDAEGRPLAGARVRVESIGHTSSTNEDQPGMWQSNYWFDHVSEAILVDSPLFGLFETTTDEHGVFQFADFPERSWFHLGVTTSSGVRLRVQDRPGRLKVAPVPGLLTPWRAGRIELERKSMAEMGFLVPTDGAEIPVVAVPAARIAGRVTTKVPGVSVAGLKVMIHDDSSHRPSADQVKNMSTHEMRIGEDGRFAVEGLNPYRVRVFVDGEGRGERWTNPKLGDIDLVRGETAELAIELIGGIPVEGTVRVRGTGAPVAWAFVGPDAGGHPSKTDAQGKYRILLPPGRASLGITSVGMGLVPTKDQSSRDVVIPEGVARFEVAPMEVAPAITTHGRVVDGHGGPVAGAGVVGVPNEQGIPLPMVSRESFTDLNGAFRLEPWPSNIAAQGDPIFLRVKLVDGTTFVAKANPAADGEVEIKLAIPPAR